MELSVLQIIVCSILLVLTGVFIGIVIMALMVASEQDERNRR
jgi:ABC-type lipoprotein release transport system permease subunit